MPELHPVERGLNVICFCPMNYYYLNSSNEPSGPVGLEEIQQLVAAGTLPADPSVAAEGASTWIPLSSIVPLAPRQTASERGLGFNSTIAAELIARVIEGLERKLTADLLGRVEVWSKCIGHNALLGGGVLGVIVMLIAAIRHNTLSLVAYAAGFALLLAIAQFAARHFLNAADSVLTHSPHRLSSRAVLDSTALFCWLAAVASLASGISAAAGLSSIWPFVGSLPPTLLLGFAGGVALHPEVVNIKVDEASAGDEAVGILSFAPKVILRMAPLLYALLTIAGALVVLLTLFDGTAQAIGSLQMLVPGLPYVFAGWIGQSMLIIAAIVPVLVYLLYLLSNLGLEVVQALLSLRVRR